MHRDPIPFIEELGYTPREAAFLYAVGMHSGYFLRRQFSSYIGRVKGAISQHFLSKAERRGHVRAIDYGQNRKVFHLHWKPIYRLLGDEDSQNRRIKGDLQIKSRLMILDYVLRDTEEHFLETEQSKVGFFTKSCHLSADVLPAGGPKGRHFPDRFPISTVQPADQTRLTIRFAFIDEGLFSLRRFERLFFSTRNFSMLSGGSQSFMSPTPSETSRLPPSISPIAFRNTPTHEARKTSHSGSNTSLISLKHATCSITQTWSQRRKNWTFSTKGNASTPHPCTTSWKRTGARMSSVWIRFQNDSHAHRTMHRLKVCSSASNTQYLSTGVLAGRSMSRC